MSLIKLDSLAADLPDIYKLIIKELGTRDFIALLCTNRKLQLAAPQTWQMSEIIGNQVLTKVLVERRNVFLTGPGGCGKTHTVKRLEYHAKRLGIEMAVVSTTGISSTYIDGVTLHSYFGIRVYKSYDKFKESRLYGSKAVVAKLKKLSIIVIDEVSMLGMRTLELVEHITRDYRGNNRPFGGLTVVVSGDFHQLPPVLDKMPFVSEVWKRLDFHDAVFGVSVRHRNDDSYFAILNRIRTESYTSHDVQLLLSREDLAIPSKTLTGTVPIRLYSTNAEALEYNLLEYAKMPGTEVIWPADDVVVEKTSRGYMPSSAISVAKAVKQLEPILVKIPQDLGLKVRAQYYITTNIDVKKHQVNGTACVLENVERQGVTVRYKCGTAYIEPVTRRFLIRDNIYLSRTQLPLKLGYAMTIHYSQGATLETAVVDVSKTFTSAQVYVALSRVRELEDLYLINFDSEKIRTSQAVLNFYADMLNKEVTCIVNGEEMIVEVPKDVVSIGGLIRVMKDDWSDTDNEYENELVTSLSLEDSLDGDIEFVYRSVIPERESVIKTIQNYAIPRVGDDVIIRFNGLKIAKIKSMRNGLVIIDCANRVITLTIDDIVGVFIA